jgi:predicted nucleotidyltransferase
MLSPEEETPMPPDLHPPGKLTRDVVLRRLRELYPELKTRFGVRQIGLFGSFARATANASSDVDLIVDFERPIGLKFVEMVDYLESRLGRKVDVLTTAGLRGIRLPSVMQEIEESVIHV